MRLACQAVSGRFLGSRPGSGPAGVGYVLSFPLGSFPLPRRMRRVSPSPPLPEWRQLSWQYPRRSVEGFGVGVSITVASASVIEYPLPSPTFPSPYAESDNGSGGHRQLLHTRVVNILSLLCCCHFKFLSHSFSTYFLISCVLLLAL